MTELTSVPDETPEATSEPDATPTSSPGIASRAQWVFASVVFGLDVLMTSLLVLWPTRLVRVLPEALGEVLLPALFIGVPIAAILTACALVVEGRARSLAHAGAIVISVPLAIGGSLAVAAGLSFGAGLVVLGVLLLGVVLFFLVTIARRARARPGPRYASNQLAVRDRRLSRGIAWSWVVVVMLLAVISIDVFLLLTAFDEYDHLPPSLAVPVVLIAVPVLLTVWRRRVRRHAEPELTATDPAAERS